MRSWRKPVLAVMDRNSFLPRGRTTKKNLALVLRLEIQTQERGHSKGVSGARDGDKDLVCFIFSRA